MALSCLLLFFALLLVGAQPDPESRPLCNNTNKRGSLDADGEWRVFNQLTVEEIDAVIEFLVQELGVYHSSLNGSDPRPTTAGPDILQRVELLEPAKAEVLEYLDNDGSVPERFAKAVVLRSTHVPKDSMEYKVGPLPLQPGQRKPEDEIGLDGDDSPVEGVIVQKLREDGEIPYNKRAPDSVTEAWTGAVINREAVKIRKIFKDTVGACYYSNSTDLQVEESVEEECGTDRLVWYNYASLDPDTTKRIMTIHWYLHPNRTTGDEMSLHAVPLTFKIEETESLADDWMAFDFEYCHQGPFETAEALLTAYKQGELVRCVADDWKDSDYDASWSRTDRCTAIRNGTEKPTPRTFDPHGQRFTIKIDSEDSASGIKFEYLGWEGHVAVRPQTGIALHDIRFRGNRIVYELALQDQFVAYSGYAGEGQIFYMDSYYGLGVETFPLRRGVDCPESAQYFPIVKQSGGSAHSDDDIVCIFEEDGQSAEWRHTHAFEDAEPRVDGVLRAVLVVRTIASVDNYDYIYSIRFKPDGSIRVDTTLAGYMVASFFDLDGQTGKNAPFGTRVHKYTFAMLHDHLSGWKVDLDILGEKNSVIRTSVKVGTWEEALKKARLPRAVPPPWHSGATVKYIAKEQLKREFGFRIRDPGTVIHTVVNDNFTNLVGEPRGYAIVHGMTTRQLLPDSHPLTKAAAWTKYHLAVTQRKEEELQSHAALFDTVAPADPLVSLDDYLDRESIVNEDLVAWVMMGVLHVPRSEDVPLISNFGTQFFIKPWNYFDELASMDACNAAAFDSCHLAAGDDYNYE